MVELWDTNVHDKSQLWHSNVRLIPPFERDKLTSKSIIPLSCRYRRLLGNIHKHPFGWTLYVLKQVSTHLPGQAKLLPHASLSVTVQGEPSLSCSSMAREHPHTAWDLRDLLFFVAQRQSSTVIQQSHKQCWPRPREAGDINVEHVYFPALYRYFDK